MKNTLKSATILLTWTSLATLPLGCGGATGGINGALADAKVSKYTALCAEHAAKQGKDLDQGAYNPAVLYAHSWPVAAETSVSESRLAAALDSSEVKRLLIISRGGLGKSRIGDSLRAQLCGTIPTFFVDLKDVAAGLTGPSPILTLVGKEMGVSSATLTQALTEQRGIFFFDSIEEVDFTKRQAVLQEVDALQAQYPKVQLVLLARPPVLDTDYGFTKADALLEIPPIECKVADAFVARQLSSDADRARFQQFAKNYGLDEKAQFGVQCVYPYLATYRDLNTLVSFEKANPLTASKTSDGASPTDIKQKASWSTVYEALLAARLQKEFVYLSWTGAEALDMVDRLIRVQIINKSASSQAFSLDTCRQAIDAKWGAVAVDAGVGGDDGQRRKQVCEKTYQSQLFKADGSSGNWIFADRNSADLFQARWLGGEIARTPAGDCGLITKHADLLGNQGVLRFFAGQPFGQRCLAQAASVRCSKGDGVAVLSELFDQGLPGGPARAQALQDARAAATGLANSEKECVSGVLDNLDKTLGH